MVDFCWAALGKRLVLSWKSNEGDGWRSRALTSSVAAYEAWDKAQRKKYGLLRTIRWLVRNNSDGKCVTIAALHWPHRTCWSWFVDWSVVHHECRGFKICQAYRQFAVVLWWRQIAVHWQNNDWMVASQFKAEAPEIVFKHEEIEERIFRSRKPTTDGEGR